MFKISWFAAFGSLMAALVAISSIKEGLVVLLAYIVGGLALWLLNHQPKSAVQSKIVMAV